MKRLTLNVTTASDGSASVLMPRITGGKIHSIHYVKHGVTPYTDGVDFTITVNTTGENVWTETNVNASTVRYPRAPTHTQAGVAAVYASGGEGVRAPVALASDQIRIAIANGGDTKIGTFYALVDDM